MFEFIRKHTKWMMVLLFALIIPSFVFFGIDNYQSMNSAANATVAVVDGQKITQAEWDEAHRQEADRLRASQPGLDSALLDSPQAKYDTLQSMVEERMLFAAANKLKLFVSDQRLARELLNDPTIASLRGPDGKLDEERYKQLLSTQGLTPASYEAMVRTRLSQQQVLGGVIAAGGWMPENSANLVLNPFFERREIQVRQPGAGGRCGRAGFLRCTQGPLPHHRTGDRRIRGAGHACRGTHPDRVRAGHAQLL